MKMFVITGASCCGKTTVIDCLEDLGFSVLRETAREIIAEGKLHPRLDPYLFQMEVARRHLEREEKIIAGGGEMAFLDRGIYDIFAFCRYLGVKIPSGFKRGICYDAVFFLDALEEFESDGIRMERGKEEAETIKKLIEAEYRARKVLRVAVPMMPAAERVKFILERVREI